MAAVRQDGLRRPDARHRYPDGRRSRLRRDQHPARPRGCRRPRGTSLPASGSCGRAGDGAAAGNAPGARRRGSTVPEGAAGRVRPRQVGPARTRGARAARPSTNGCLPTSSAARPSTNGCRPTSFAARPSTNGCLPTSSAARPSTNGCRPTSSAARPSTNGCLPTSSAARPRTSGRRPTSSASRPSASRRLPSCRARSRLPLPCVLPRPPGTRGAGDRWRRAIPARRRPTDGRFGDPGRKERDLLTSRPPG